MQVVRWRHLVLVGAMGALARGEPLATQGVGASASRPGVSSGASGEMFRLQGDANAARIPFLSWDTEGGDRSGRNLLRAPMVLRWSREGRTESSGEVPAERTIDGGGGIRYRITTPDGSEAIWAIGPARDHLEMEIAGDSKAIELVFPFDAGVTPTTALPADCDDAGHLQLPILISAPDFGQVLLTATSQGSGNPVRARLEGNRPQKTLEFSVEIPGAAKIELRPRFLRPPEGLRDVAIWESARRGWFNAFQATSRWGDASQPFSSPPALLGNNVLSDPASVSLWFYADQAFWTPELAPGVSAMKLVRRTIDYWLDHRTRPTGEVIGYWAYGGFLDANAGPLIAAWDYVEATGDRDWLLRRIDRLEFIAEYLAKRDIDGDGMIEATQSGNRGTLQQPNRSCAWWDAINCGHKDAYTNALIYRAFRCLADLERRAGRGEQRSRYTHLADRLKASYFKTLYRSKTGWLAWWKSEDGELHDYAAPTVNGLAIEYGLVEPAEGRAILERLHAKMKEVGFTRFDLGIPSTLVPVLRADYLLPDAIGCPITEDGTDTLGQYMNGGISAGQALHFLNAHYVVGVPEKADAILKAMLSRQARGEFQNGVRDAAMQGIDWTTWDGKPSGYEGYLADSFRFLQAVLLREAPFRARLYDVLSPSN